MRQELGALRKKRKECDSDYARLTKRINSCENAMKALPNLQVLIWKFCFMRNGIRIH